MPGPVCLIFSNHSEAAVNEHSWVSGQRPVGEVWCCGAQGRLV